MERIDGAADAAECVMHFLGFSQLVFDIFADELELIC